MLDKLVVLALTARARVANWLHDQSGQDIMEYALLGGFIAVAFAAAATLTPLSTSMHSMVNAIAECVDFDSVCP